MGYRACHSESKYLLIQKIMRLAKPVFLGTVQRSKNLLYFFPCSVLLK